MRVLAIDPGYDRLGVAVMDNIDGKEVVVHSDCITTPKDKDLSERLLLLGEAVESLIEDHSPEAVAIENLYFNKNQKTAIAVAEARGIIMYLGKKHKLKIFEYTPQQIKIAVTGYGKSTKEQVTEMVLRLIPNVQSGKLDDEYDAIAVGITCLASER
jgi:crossover junction endodeoxyribonuclease RuvC